MESASPLYQTLVQVLGEQPNWLDLRHLHTLVWMMVGLIESGMISLTAWVPYVHSRAQYAQSTVRRFTRWLENDRIEVHALYGPLIQHALADWGSPTLYLAFDTSLLWERYCLVRLAIVYRGRAVPLIWVVLDHPSASVAHAAYQSLLDHAATLLPLHCRVVFLADRGFADTALLKHLRHLGWHWRIRIKGSFWVYRRGRRACKVSRISLAKGQARCWREVEITATRYGPVHLALARQSQSRDYWWVVSDEPTDLDTFREYGLRFDIEENFLDDKSNGFQLESSLLRSAATVQRLCFVLAVTTLYLVSQGTRVVAEGKRRWVDAHWFRGNSYLKIGWAWVKWAVQHGVPLGQEVCLASAPDPEPATASRIQAQRPKLPAFQVIMENFA